MFNVSVGKPVFDLCHCGVGRVFCASLETRKVTAQSGMSKSQDPQERGVQPAPSASHTELPKELQRLVDDEDSLLDQIYDGT